MPQRFGDSAGDGHLGASGAALRARQLAAVSSFGETEAAQLPFDLQRSSLFLAAVAALAVAGVAVAVAIKPIAGVAAVVGLGLLLAVVLNERLGLILLAALVPITSGLGRGVPVPGFRLSELLAGGVGIVLIASARRVVRWSVFDWLALAYAVATLVLGSLDLIARSAPFTGSEISLMLGPFQFLLLYRAVALTTPDAGRRRLVVRLLLVASIPVAVLAIGQQFNAPGFRSFIVTITGKDVYSGGVSARATGPFPHWHNLGGYLFMILLLDSAVLLRRVRGIMPTWALLSIGGLDAVALIQTLSITPILGVVAGGLILGVWLGGFQRIVLALAALALVAGLVFAPRLESRYTEQFNRAPGTARSAFVPQTVQYRYDLWTNQILPQLHGRWTTGYGPDLPPELQNFPYTESLYINLLFRGGVILLGVWIAMAVALGITGARSAQLRDPLQQAVGATVATAMLMLLFMQFLESYFVDSGTPHVLWTLAGVLSYRLGWAPEPGEAAATGRLMRRAALGV